MHLIFIRHGDPDYKNDSLTEKGKREAELLADRIAGWNVTDFYVSPYGRAQETLKPALIKMGREAQTMDWLHEFDYRVRHPKTKQLRCCWDWMPREYYGEKKAFDRHAWETLGWAKKEKIGKRYHEVCSAFDALLAQYDYNRLDFDSAIYNCLPHTDYDDEGFKDHLTPFQKDFDGRNLVFVCHLGSMFTIISHLVGCSPLQLWQGFFVAPTSVTVLGAEERTGGEVVFRVQQLGSVDHLKAAGEEASASGFFGNFTCF